MTHQRETKDIFLCYSGADKEWVIDLATRLEQEEKDGRHIVVWLDEWDIRPGENIVLAINNGLKISRYVGVVLSPECISAPWPQLEWSSAIYSDPANRHYRILPILRRSCEIPPVLSMIKYLDFRHEEKFQQEYSRLVAVLKGQDIPRGQAVIDSNLFLTTISSPPLLLSHQPDPCSEEIISNLFPVIRHPNHIWGASTPFRYHSDIYSEFPSTRFPPFILKEGKLYTFQSLQEPSSPFNKAILSRPYSIQLMSWLTDPDFFRYLMELLNRCLHSHCRSIGMTYDSTSKKYYFKTKTSEIRTFKWKPAKKMSRRKIVKPYQRQNGTIPYWKHFAGKLHFISVAEDFYLMLWPAWVYTKDSQTLIPPKKRGPITTRGTSIEKNDRVLYNLRLLTAALSKGKDTITIETGAEPIIISIASATSNLPVGIYGDWLDMNRFFESAQEMEDEEEPSEELE